MSFPQQGQWQYFSRLQDIPVRRSGVYVLYCAGHVVYVGRSIRDVRGRIGQHSSRRCFDWIKVSFTNDRARLNKREEKLIFRLRPEYNQTTGLSKHAHGWCR